jgi:hypothetical protein
LHRAHDECSGSVATDDACRLCQVVNIPGISVDVRVPAYPIGGLVAEVRFVPDLVGGDAARVVGGNLIYI